LRSIPNKLLGVIAMFSAILILLLLPITDVSRSRGMQFKPLSKAVFFVFVANFLILMQLGAKHVESPFIEFGQLSTVLYFLYFSVAMYGITTIENSFVDLNYVTTYKSYANIGLVLQSNLGLIKKWIRFITDKLFLIYYSTSVYYKTQLYINIFLVFTFVSLLIIILISLQLPSIEIVSNYFSVKGVCIPVLWFMDLYGLVEDGIQQVYLSTANNAGLAAEASHVSNISQCTHPVWHHITPTVQEAASAQTPLCDFNPHAGVKHIATSSEHVGFYTCKDCHAVCCQGCKL